MSDSWTSLERPAENVSALRRGMWSGQNHGWGWEIENGRKGIRHAVFLMLRRSLFVFLLLGFCSHIVFCSSLIGDGKPICPSCSGLRIR